MGKKLLLGWFVLCVSFAAIAEGRAYADAPAGGMTSETLCTIDFGSGVEIDGTEVVMPIAADSNCEPVEAGDMVVLLASISDSDFNTAITTELIVCLFADEAPIGVCNGGSSATGSRSVVLIADYHDLEALMTTTAPYHFSITSVCTVSETVVTDVYDGCDGGVSNGEAGSFDDYDDFVAQYAPAGPTSPFGDTSAVGDLAVDIAAFVFGVLLPAVLLALVAGAILRLIFKAIRRVVASV